MTTTKPPPEYVLSLLIDRVDTTRLNRVAIAANRAYNSALDFSKKAYGDTGAHIDTRGQLYRHVRAHHRNCREAPSDAIYAACNEVWRNIRRFMETRKTDGAKPYPAFRKWQKDDTYFYADRVVMDHTNRRIQLPKLGWFAVTGLQDMPLNGVQRVKMVKRGVRWYAVVKPRQVRLRYTPLLRGRDSKP